MRGINHLTEKTLSILHRCFPVLCSSPPSFATVLLFSLSFSLSFCRPFYYPISFLANFLPFFPLFSPPPIFLSFATVLFFFLLFPFLVHVIILFHFSQISFPCLLYFFLFSFSLFSPSPILLFFIISLPFLFLYISSYFLSLVFSISLHYLFSSPPFSLTFHFFSSTLANFVLYFASPTPFIYLSKSLSCIFFLSPPLLPFLPYSFHFLFCHSCPYFFHSLLISFSLSSLTLLLFLSYLSFTCLSYSTGVLLPVHTFDST